MRGDDRRQMALGRFFSNLARGRRDQSHADCSWHMKDDLPYAYCEIHEVGKGRQNLPYAKTVP